MHILTPESLAGILTICSENDHYKACIAFDDRNSMNEFVSEINAIDEIPNVRGVISFVMDYGKLEFLNGSVIEIIIATENNLRGKRYNQIVIAGDFKRELLSYLQSIVIPYKHTMSFEHEYESIWLINQEEPESSEELNTFLSSFVINEEC